MNGLDLATLKSRAEAEAPRWRRRFPDWADAEVPDSPTSERRPPAGNGWSTCRRSTAALPELEGNPLGSRATVYGARALHRRRQVALRRAGRPRGDPSAIFPAARIEVLGLRPQPPHRGAGGLRGGREFGPGPGARRRPRPARRSGSSSGRGCAGACRRARGRGPRAAPRRSSRARRTCPASRSARRRSCSPASWRASRTALPKPPARTWSSSVTMRGTTAAWLRRSVRSSGLDEARVHDADGEVLLGLEPVGDAQRVPHHRAERPEDDVRALAQDLGVADLEALWAVLDATPMPGPRG
jgi:hypothetical protein